MSEPTREQLFGALRKADAAGDSEAAKVIARRIKAMDAGGPEAVQKALEGGAGRDEILSLAAQNNLTINEADLDANLASRDAGGGTAAVEKPSNLDYLVDSAQNIGIGLTQGGLMALEFPLQAARDIGGVVRSGIREGAGSVLDAVGLDGAADWMRGGSALESDLVPLPSQQIENAMPTPEGMEGQRFGAQVLGGALVPFGPKGKPQAAPLNKTVQATPKPKKGVLDDAALIVAEGQKRKVPVYTTDIKPPESGMGRWIKQTVPEKIPVAGVSGLREKQQVARVKALTGAVEEFGGSAGRALFDDSDTLPQEISKMLTKQRGDRLTKLTGEKRSVIESITAPFTEAPNAMRVIAEKVRELKGIDAEEYAPVIERLQRFGEQFTSGKTLAQIEGQRRLLGSLFDNPNLAHLRDDGQKAINSIYGPLRDDMGNFIEAQAGAAARTKWQGANDELAAMAGELKSAKFKGVLRDADVTPEKISRILFGDAENVSDMRKLVENLNPAGKAKVRGALITRAFEKAGGADGVSVEKFLNNLKTLSGKIGVAFQGEDRAALEGFRKLMEATRRGAESGANVRTGEQNLPAVLGVGATQLLGLAGGTATLGVGGLLARLYESPVTRNRIIGLGKAKAGSKAEATRIEALMKASIPVVNQWKDDMARVANDNVGVSAAAGEGPEDE